MDMTTIVAKQHLPSSENSQQHQKAEKFYQAVQAEYPDRIITLTGHSLGGFLALYVACRQRLDATVYNAPDPCQLLADMPQELELKLINYRHVYDAMGKMRGNGTVLKCSVIDAFSSRVRLLFTTVSPHGALIRMEK